MLIPLIGLGWTEILVIAGVIFVLFGASRIPMAFRSLGEGINSFKEGLDGKGKSEADNVLTAESTPQLPSKSGDTDISSTSPTSSS